MWKCLGRGNPEAFSSVLREGKLGLLEMGQGDPGSNMQLLGVPHGPVCFEELKKFLQDDLGVGRHACVLQRKAGLDRAGDSLFQVQYLPPVYGPAFR
jgi:hypothetical protein